MSALNPLAPSQTVASEGTSGTPAAIIVNILIGVFVLVLLVVMVYFVGRTKSSFSSIREINNHTVTGSNPQWYGGAVLDHTGARNPQHLEKIHNRLYNPVTHPMFGTPGSPGGPVTESEACAAWTPEALQDVVLGTATGSFNGGVNDNFGEKQLQAAYDASISA